ncbi:MAG: hypothetical protein ACLR8Y_08455 [Alistipes indistinctus]
MQTVTLTTCDNAAEAHLLQGALANAGIESVLTNEYTASTLPNLCGMMGMGVYGRGAGKGLRPGPAVAKYAVARFRTAVLPLLRLDRHRTSLGAAADSRHFCVPFATGLDAARQYQRLPTAAAVAGRISANRLHLPDKLPETASQALPRTRIRRRNNASVPPRRPPRPRDPLPAPPRKPACTWLSRFYFPPDWPETKKTLSLSSLFMKNGYPKPQET